MSVSRETGWRRSSFCGPNGPCVEVKINDYGDRLVRDSKHPLWQGLRFTPAEWDAFVQGVKAGEFD